MNALVVGPCGLRSQPGLLDGRAGRTITPGSNRGRRGAEERNDLSAGRPLAI